MSTFAPDHNGECTHCDEWLDAHSPSGECPTDPGQAVANQEHYHQQARLTHALARVTVLVERHDGTTIDLTGLTPEEALDRLRVLGVTPADIRWTTHLLHDVRFPPQED